VCKFIYIYIYIYIILLEVYMPRSGTRSSRPGSESIKRLDDSKDFDYHMYLVMVISMHGLMRVWRHWDDSYVY
jgi:hypothetical protein